MKIITCIKQVPDSEAKVKTEGGQVAWGESPLVINPSDEYAVEGALQLKEANNGTVMALCLGSESANDALNMRSPWAQTKPSSSRTRRLTRWIHKERRACWRRYWAALE